MEPCRCRTGTLKNPTKCLWRWEPDRRSYFFFSPPAHLCAVTHMTEISLIVTLKNQFTLPSLTEVIFGTDGECHLVNAINACFPQAVQTLCTKQLKDNTRFNLWTTFPKPVVEEIFNTFFILNMGF